jgi:hypothetical protein
LELKAKKDREKKEKEEKERLEKEEQERIQHEKEEQERIQHEMEEQDKREHGRDWDDKNWHCHCEYDQNEHCKCKSNENQRRLVRRMQPDAHAAVSLPRAPLRWGDLNVLHTTDTHGWLEGHLKEPNYGADWGDFVSFAAHMRRKASNLGVDLLLIDSGDLHDGNGLSDATSPNGAVSNPIFENVDYDLLTIGNHELYMSEIAYDHFNQFAKVFGDRYLTSNVQIKNPAGDFQYIGKQYRYFETNHGEFRRRWIGSF